MGSGNCQDWVAGAIQALEVSQMVEKTRLCSGESKSIQAETNRYQLSADRKELDLWGAKIADPSTIDARFSVVEVRKVGKLSNEHQASFPEPLELSELEVETESFHIESILQRQKALGTASSDELHIGKGQSNQIEIVIDAR